MDNKVSLCMIVKDEEKNLPRCLESIKNLVDEMIIVDTGSKDKTVEIAQSYGAKVYYFKWCDNFSAARNESLKHAAKDWILILDADDEFCSEDKIKFENLKLNLDKKYVYCFETLSYLGYEKSFDISINMNPRLFKNKYGYHYSGAVHNQLLNEEHGIISKFESIRVYHYGYTNKSMIDKNKRARNMTILKKLIREEPQNKFNYFNLGNEYCCLNEQEKALSYYYKCYEDFKPYLGYSPKLLERIVEVNYELKNFDKSIEFIDIGLKYYPNFIDLYYMQGIIYDELGKYLYAIKSFQMCIEIVNPPEFLKSIYGVENFRSFDELSKIYIKLNDYDSAYEYCIKSLKSKPDYLGPLYNILKIFEKKEMPINEMKFNIEEFFSDFPREYYFIADLFYKGGYYETALKYLEKLTDSVKVSKEILVLKSNTLVRTGKFDECIRLNVMSQDNLFYLQFLTNNIISFISIQKYDLAFDTLNKFNYENISSEALKELKVYRELVNLFMGKKIDVLSNDENERGYTKFIIEIIEIFIINNELDGARKSLKLLDLTADKYKFLEVGKLYFKYGYLDMAKQEIFKSVKMYNLIDKDSIKILKEVISI